MLLEASYQSGKEPPRGAQPDTTSSACCGRCLGTGGSLLYWSARGQWQDGIVFELGDILDYKAPPLISIREIFEHITEKLVSTYPEELEALCNKFANTPLKILTCCSGTKSPILGLTMVQKCEFLSHLTSCSNYCSSLTRHASFL
jgi:hypothetical protein